MSKAKPKPGPQVNPLPNIIPKSDCPTCGKSQYEILKTTPMDFAGVVGDLVYTNILLNHVRCRCGQHYCVKEYVPQTQT